MCSTERKKNMDGRDASERVEGVAPRYPPKLDSLKSNTRHQLGRT